ncbi:dihydroneopterin aldolase [Mesosutterella sp. OilRF-GAM-744-9]|uniref:dihydroneopterin aldolase n=1 Tax=Mesosutterella porci TaxID=2915351 RepID=A0ABS9MNJ6_9BURK|nr:dihydroneopterin aldolase [Mesosutterella sp. oilRF-744-WT-GAM-9]MCG5030192.1 dihydroneopterin aldolase [Mesosutterella sp. oilRF-744-WT-GAM-9]MCI6531243.1 dihydroneopterin aldolase [Mesosutterella sp.]
MTTLPEIAAGCIRIFIEDLRVEARLGIYPREINSPQTILVTLEVWIPRARLDDAIENTVNYDDLCDIARQVLQSGHLNLVESAVEKMLARLAAMPGVKAARVCCRKPHAVRGARAAGVEALYIKE